MTSEMKIILESIQRSIESLKAETNKTINDKISDITSQVRSLATVVNEMQRREEIDAAIATTAKNAKQSVAWFIIKQRWFPYVWLGSVAALGGERAGALLMSIIDLVKQLPHHK